VEGLFKTEIGKTFVRVLKDAGVYKDTDGGRAAFMRFIDLVNRK
jgi:UDPglucose--hexose-1-phosphate uridylyltransferase